jgi:hypothetical protein
LTYSWTLEILFPWILLRDPYSVQIKDVPVRFGEPKDSFVPSRKSLPAMKAVLKGPNYAVAKSESKALADPVNIDVERKDFAIICHMISDLPTETPVIG